MGLALDGSVHGNATASSVAVSLTTSNANDDIFVVVTTNGGPVTSVTASGLTFTLHKNGFFTANQYLEIWCAKNAGILTAASITVNNTASGFTTVDALGVSGADTSTVFDGNGSIPNITTVNGADAIISTNTANCFLLGCYRQSTTASPTAGPGLTLISGADFQLVEYQIVSATQTNFDFTKTTGTGDSRVGIGTAIIQASGGGSFKPAWAVPSNKPVIGTGTY